MVKKLLESEIRVRGPHWKLGDLIWNDPVVTCSSVKDVVTCSSVKDVVTCSSVRDVVTCSPMSAVVTNGDWARTAHVMVCGRCKQVS